METTLHEKKRIHPLMATAAVAVILVSLIGVAAITGVLPTSNGSPAQVNTQLTDSGAQAVSAPVQQSPQYQNAPVVRHTTVEAPRHVVAAACNNCGTVEAVRTITHAAQQGSGVGAVAGAVLGGVLGNQVGGGDGRKLATVAGAIGGGYAGNEVEKRNNTTTSYDVRVRMEDGSTRNFSFGGAPGWRAGDRVRVIDGTLRSIA